MGTRTRAATVGLELASRLEVLDRTGELVDQLAKGSRFEEDARLGVQTTAQAEELAVRAPGVMASEPR